MKVRYLRAAKADLAAIHAFIADRNPQAAKRVIAEIRGIVMQLPDFPNRFRVGAAPGSREAVTRYGYIVVYRVSVDRIDVLSVFHGAQDKPRSG